MSELVGETAGQGNGWQPGTDSATSQPGQFERLVAELSNTLVMTPAERIDGKILQWMQRATEFLDCEGSSIAQFAEDGLSARLTHTWLAPGLPALPDSLGSQEWPWVFEELKKGRAVAFLSPGELPPEARIDTQTYIAIGVRSCITVPLAWEGRHVGGFTVATFSKDHVWPDDLVRRSQCARRRKHRRGESSRFSRCGSGRCSASRSGERLAHRPGSPAARTADHAT